MPPRIRMTQDDTGIITYSRAEFFGEIFDYNPGECCTFLCPFGGGKTQIALEALESVATPKLQATVFVMKPKDKTITKWTPRLGYETVRDWPPSTMKLLRRAFGKKPSGYILWPRDTGNQEYDDWWIEQVFRRALNLMYTDAKKRPNIMFLDETYSLENELNLRKLLIRAWTKGRFGNGLWAASQRPAFISGWAYQAQHIFIGYDADRRAQERYAEIGGGFDPDVVKAIVSSLKRFQFLYISREERAMCIIDAS